jgi:hypothetical protein
MFGAASRSVPALSPVRRSSPGNEKTVTFPWIAGALAVCAAAQTPTYTNADLERVRPLRDQIGGASEPAHRPAPAEVEREAPDLDEARWRREAERLEERRARDDDRIAELRYEVEALRRDPRVLPYSDPRIVRAEARIEQLERRRDERWRRFLERARRAGVPPGWLR